MREPELLTAGSPVAIAQFAGEHGVDFGAIFAGDVTTAMVPLLVLPFSPYDGD